MTYAHAKQESVHLEACREGGAEQARGRRRRVDPAVLVSALAFIVLVAALGHVAQRAKLATLSYELHLSNARLAELKRVQTHLLVEVEKARSLARVEADARTRLGMIKPESTAWVVLAPAETKNPVELAGSGDDRGRMWMSAVSDWFQRVRSEIQAALPLHLRESGRP